LDDYLPLNFGQSVSQKEQLQISQSFLKPWKVIITNNLKYDQIRLYL
jgi:hypothetical protein